jgi:hypothetical protein
MAFGQWEKDKENEGIKLKQTLLPNFSEFSLVKDKVYNPALLS